jgi:regulator of protease activity HflC (stomatin/prohibitin superfamily)
MSIATLLTGIATLIWVAFFAVMAYMIFRSFRNQPIKRSGPILGGIALLAVLVTSISAGLVFIQPEERGVVISAVAPKGYREAALQPGLHWIIPYAETVVRYPISTQTYTMSIATGEGQVQGDDSISARTLDGQEIFVDASVIYRVDPEKVVQVHIQWQRRYDTDLVRAQARGIIRDVVSQYRVDEVVSTKRAELTSRIREALTTKLGENGLMLVDYVLRNIAFSPEYGASIEQKQIAEQQAQQAKFVVETKRQEAEQARQTAQGAADAAVIRAKGDAQARIVQAEAEAKAMQLISAALKDNPDLLSYQYITKLSPTIETMLVPSSSPFILNIPGLGSSGTTTTVPTTTAPTTVVPNP